MALAANTTGSHSGRAALVRLGRGGRFISIDGPRGADGRVDKTIAEPRGATPTVDRSHDVDGIVDTTITRRTS